MVATNIVTAHITEIPIGVEVITADIATHQFNTTFPFIFGRAILEHIADIPGFVRAVERLLKDGGVAYFDGGPMWESPHGSHCWIVASSGRSYQFPINNPLEGYDHLLYSLDELEAKLCSRLEYPEDAADIVAFVMRHPFLNRLTNETIVQHFMESSLKVLVQQSDSHPLPDALRPKLGGRDVTYGRLIITVQK